MESHDAEPPEARAAAARDVASAGESFSTWHSLASRRLRRGALGALLVTAAVLAPAVLKTSSAMFLVISLVVVVVVVVIVLSKVQICVTIWN